MKKDDMKSKINDEIEEVNDNLHDKIGDNITEKQKKEIGEETKDEKIKDLQDKLIRSFAEMENMRKRTQKDKEDTIKFCLQNFARDLINVVDNLSLAVKSAHLENISSNKDSKDEIVKNIIVGLEMTEKEMMNVFSGYGIKKIDCIGQKFNAEFHQAVFEEESKEVPGTIIRVLQDGYLIHERLLRPSMVGVAKKIN